MTGPLADADVLAAWEAGSGSSPAGRGLALLERAAPAGEVGSWTVGRAAAGLLELHAATFGARVEAHTPCPACGEELEVGFAAADVLAESGQGGGATVDDVELRVPVVDDLLAAAGAASTEEARAALLERVVVRSPHPPASFPDELVERIGEALAAADPQADLRLSFTCPECETETRIAFDVPGFVWREVDLRARELLDEVASLAAAYGWSEAEILRLSPARRRAYLDLAAA